MNPEDLAQVQVVPQENATPTESPAEIKQEVGQPSQGGDNTPDADNLPFHKHPRWIQKNREVEEMRQKLEELLPLKSEIESLKHTPTHATDPVLPDWWVDAFGTDEASKEAYKKHSVLENQKMREMEDSISKRVRDDIKHEQEERTASVEKWENYIETQITDLQGKGLKFDRNELLKVVDDYSKDVEGNYIPGYVFPFDKAYEILQLKKQVPTPTDKARENAASISSTGTKTGATTLNQMPTLTDIRQRGWGAWRGN